MLAAVGPGDVVWDVGANVGLYTAEFARLVGPTGTVIAFEPAQNCVAELRKRFAGDGRVVIHPIALGDFDGAVSFQAGGDEVSPLGQVRPGMAGNQVPVKRGDSIWRGSGVAPSVVKIDVEGFEPEVLTGMRELLAAGYVRALFIEVHFALLEQRAMALAPAAIVRSLRQAVFKTRWVDPSHLGAWR